MTQPILSREEFSTTTQSFSDQTAPLQVVGTYAVESSTSDVGYCEVVVVDQSRPREHILPNHVSIEDIETELSKIEGMRGHLADARSWVAKTLYPNQRNLRTLRLSRGLTQSVLARKIGTSQPHLARMEKGQGDVRRDTMRRLCDALEVDMNTLDKALEACSDNG
jgi:DNA-binding Xre family transcriptional regulator